MTEVVIGSLFSGIGGLDLGLERAGLGPVAWQCEADPFCRAVLAKHWPYAVRYTDVRTLDPSALAPVDIVCGGFPCQDISAANHAGLGLDGPRSGLWFEYLRIVAGLRPRVVVVENVGRLVRRGLDTVAGGLVDLGYTVDCTRIRAVDVGAPQLRERLFLVAHRDGSGREAGRDRPDPAGRGVAGRGGSAAVADGHGGGRGELGEPHAGGERGPRRDIADRRSPAGRGTSAAGGDQPGPAVAGLGGPADGVPLGLAGPGPGGAWPAGRGDPQAPWEASRTEPRAPRAEHRMRPARLRALGNSVVPQVAYVVGRYVAELLHG